MNIYLVCPVRAVTPEQTAEMDNYVSGLEKEGHHVHYPPRDVDQTDPTGFEICTRHLDAIKKSDRVDIFWDVNSKGSHFDLGMAFALDKRINLVQVYGEIPAGKSYIAVMKEIQTRQSK